MRAELWDWPFSYLDIEKNFTKCEVERNRSDSSREVGC